MKKLFYLIPLAALLLAGNAAWAQNLDSVKIMSYNVGQYGRTKSGCPLQTPAKKNPFMRTILRYVNPDIVGFVKMYSNPTFDTSTVMQVVFDSLCAGCWGHSVYTNKSGYSQNEILYFNKNKFGFISTTTLYYDANVHDINLHRLYYKSPTLSATHDTVFLNIILVHDASGSSADADRATEIGGALTTLRTLVNAPGNYIFMGDFNTQSSGETCYQDMIDSTKGNTRFYDPINKPGNWSTYPATFARYLTHTTRTSDPGDCLAYGGLSNRFDHILCTAPLMWGTDSMQYINNSYTTLGNDGGHVGKSINDTPNYSGVPQAVLNALYYMSEHLPIVARFNISRKFGSNMHDINMPLLHLRYNSLVTDNLKMEILSPSVSGNALLYVYNLEGQIVKTVTIERNEPIVLSLQNLTTGLYIFKLVQKNSAVFTGRFMRIEN